MILTPIELGRRIIKDFQTPPFILEWQKLYNDLIYKDRFNRLVISAPVRHGKSWFWAKLGIAAYLMNHPDRRVAYVSHMNLADEYGWLVRGIIQDYGKKFRGVQIAKDTQSKTNFKMTAGGGLTCYSAGNPISGFGFDLIVVDDIVRKQEETDNEGQREKIWRYFYSDLLNRLTPTGKMAVIMARRHPDDLCGRLKDHSSLSDLPPSKRFAFKVYKAINGDQALWPQEWPIEKLRDTEKDYALAGNSYLFNSLYQQDPSLSPAGLEWSGDLFNGITYTEMPVGTIPKIKVCALDPSKGRNARTGDYGAMCYLIIDTNGHVWCEDIKLVRLPGPQLEDQFIAWIEAHPCDGACVESDLDGGSMCEMITRKLTMANKLGLANKMWNLPSAGLGEKAERLRRDLSRLLAVRKLHIKEVGHFRLALSQFRNFSPHGNDHDDSVDCISMGVRMAIKLCGG
jgi:hypothetical protein